MSKAYPSNLTRVQYEFLSEMIPEPKPGDPRFKEVEESVTFQLGFPSGILGICSTSYGLHEGRRFRDRWIASIVSNIGGWMEDTAGAWLMTSLTISPLLVALMQTEKKPLFSLGLLAQTDKLLATEK
ncbi:MAG: MFS transporter [Nostoc sp.]|uniref:MFS transporter n=1 Tax=Nostoc sp. TaxID=1180 RepID=UPI002FF9AC2E